MLMKIKEKGVEREDGKICVCGRTGHPGDGAVSLSRAATALLTIESCTMRA